MSFLSARLSIASIGALLAIAALPAAPAFAGDELKATVDDDGAQCPGAQHTSIQDALDAAAAAGQPKVVLEVCAGTYAESVLATGLDKLHLKGADQDATRIVGPSGTPVIEVRGVNEAKIEKVGIRAPAGTVGLRIADSGAEVKDVAVVGPGPFGFLTGTGIEVSGEHAGVKIKHVDVRGTSGAGIHVHDTSGVHLDHVSMVHSGDDGLRVERAADVKVKHALVDHASDEGIELRDSQDLKLDHVEVVDTREEGIELYTTSNSTLKHVTVRDAGSDGIRMHTGSQYNEVDKSRVANATFDGFEFSGSTAGNVVTHATVVDSGDRAFEIFGTGHTLEKNDVSDSRGDGLYVSGGAGHAIVKNSVGSSGGHGIRVEHVVDARIDKNDVVGAVFSGIRLGPTTSGIAVSKNVVSGSPGASCTDLTASGLVAANTWHKNAADAPSSPAWLCPVR